MADASFAIGIDLGTTYCCVAVLGHQSKKPEVIQSEVGKNTTPSYVAYDLEEDDIYVGEPAKDFAFDYPENVIFDIKRLIGRTFYDSHVQKYNHLWPFHLANIHGLVGVKIDEKTLLPQVIAKELISHLKERAEAVLGCSVNSAVVTVPVYYNELQEGVTREACAEAGLKHVHFVTEPVAAAVAYGLQTTLQSSETKTCLIFDLGGGTFDVTIFTLNSDKQVEIRATGGDDRLGGEDFNDLLADYCISDFKKKHGVDLAQGKDSKDEKVSKRVVRNLRRIRDQCELQKRFLSSTTSVVISLDGLHPGTPMVVPVTRRIFEDLIAGHLKRCMATLDGMFKQSGFTKGDIDDVVLIGGSCRIPKVQAIVSGYFDGMRLCRSIDADEAVACGAAVHACNIFHGKSSASGVTLNEMRGKNLSHFQLEEEEISAETYKPQSIRWTAEVVDGFPRRCNHAAVCVEDTIYSFGGYSDDKNYLYDGAMDVYTLNTLAVPLQWKSLSQRPDADAMPKRYYHTAVAHGAVIYSWGGCNPYECDSILYSFNTVTLTWSKPQVRGAIPGARRDHSAVIIRNKMYIFGGYDYIAQCLGRLHALDLSTFTWSLINLKGNSPKSRQRHTATTIMDRYMLIFGGLEDQDETCGSSNTLVRFDVETKTWTQLKTTGALPQGRHFHSSFMHKGSMYTFGGFDRTERKCLIGLFSFDPETLEWMELVADSDGQQPSPRNSLGCVVVQDRVFMFGGFNYRTYFDDTKILEIN